MPSLGASGTAGNGEPLIAAIDAADRFAALIAA
jgi:hypothetical protein